MSPYKEAPAFLAYHNTPQPDCAHLLVVLSTLHTRRVLHDPITRHRHPPASPAPPTAALLGVRHTLGDTRHETGLDGLHRPGRTALRAGSKDKKRSMLSASRHAYTQGHYNRSVEDRKDPLSPLVPKQGPCMHVTRARAKPTLHFCRPSISGNGRSRLPRARQPPSPAVCHPCTNLLAAQVHQTRGAVFI